MIKKTDIPNDTVTFAKLQNAVADNVVVGNVNGAGEAFQELAASDIYSIVGSEITSNLVIDEDDMASDSATKVPTQQSVKAYVDGLVAAGQDFVLISTQTASNSATISFTDLSSTYSKYVVEFYNLVVQTENDELCMRVSSDNGSSYDSGASAYAYLNWQGHWTGTNLDSGSATYAPIVYNPTNTSEDIGNGTGELLHGKLELYDPSASAYTYAQSTYCYLDETGSLCHGGNSVVRLTASSVDAIQFFFTASNIVSGTFKLYGYK